MPMIFHRRGRKLLRLALFTAAAAALWGAGLFLFAATIPEPNPGAETGAKTGTRTDAIVVLTGGSGRLDEGLRLLAEGLAGQLFVSGVYRGMDVKRLLAISKAGPASSQTSLESRISIGNAVDTIENALETAGWVKQGGYKSLRLVTAAYHMPRSLLEFRHAMPAVRLIPHPVFPEHVKSESWWRWPGTASLIISEYNKFLVAWVRLKLAGQRPAGAGARAAAKVGDRVGKAPR